MSGKQRLGVVALGLAIGIAWGAGMFVLGVTAWALDWGKELVEPISSLYIGYGPTPLGSAVGAAWGFIDGFIGGAVVALLYNYFAREKE